MTRYILIDNFSGFVWGDSLLDGQKFEGDVMKFAAALDASYDDTGLTYEWRDNDPHTTASGYHVYEASESLLIVKDYAGAGIDAVERDCRRVGFIAITQRED